MSNITANYPWFVPESIIIASGRATRDDIDALIACGALMLASESEEDRRSGDRQIDVLGLVSVLIESKFRLRVPASATKKIRAHWDLIQLCNVANHIAIMLAPYPAILAQILATAAPGDDEILADPEQCQKAFEWEIARGEHAAGDRAIAMLVAKSARMRALRKRVDPTMN